MDTITISPSTKEGDHHDHLTDASLVSEALPAFLEYLEVDENRSPATLLRYEAHLRRLIDEVGDCAVRDITTERITLLKRRLMDSRAGPATIAGILSGIRSFLRFLRSARSLQVLEPEKVRRPRIPKRQVEYLSRDELARYFKAIETDRLYGLRDRALISVLFATGMRISEALSLNRDDIDWEAREARVIGKGNKERKVFFSETALEWLGKYIRYRWDQNPALFVTRGDAPQRLKAQGTWKRFRRYAVLAGLGRNVYPHMFRHTLATTLLANGCPIGHIRALLGHEHLTTTCKYYLGIISDAEVKAAHQRFLPSEINEEKKQDVTLPGQ